MWSSLCGIWPPSTKLFFKEIVFRPLHTFGEPIVYIPTKFRKIFWSGADIRSQNEDMLHVWCIAAICQIGFSKEMRLDNSTPWGRKLITYIPTKFRKKYLDRGQRYAPKTKFKTGPLHAEFYFRFRFWQMSSFGDLPVYDFTKFQENRSTRGWVICNSTFSMLTFKPTLPAAQRHSALMQVIYKQQIAPRNV